MKLLAFFIILLAFISCKNADTSKQYKIIATDTVKTESNQTQIMSQTHSINQANAATIKLDGDNINKASISKKDSSIVLIANMKVDHRIFGFEKPDTGSKKMILLSIFTDDVKDNPFNCPFGAYYSITDMKDAALKFVGYDGNFIKVNVLKNNTIEGVVFIEKNWVEFDD